MALITYRKLDANGDPLWGNGQGSFVSDVDAVAQAIRTRLLLLAGEWWENLAIGTPVFQSMLGSSTSDQALQAVALLLKQRIAGSPFVTSVSEVQISRDPTTRAVSFTAHAYSPFGTILIGFTPPGSSAASLT
jgi:hypothetical protein